MLATSTVRVATSFTITWLLGLILVINNFYSISMLFKGFGFYSFGIELNTWLNTRFTGLSNLKSFESLFCSNLTYRMETTILI